MRLKKVVSLTMAMAMTLSLAACGSSSENGGTSGSGASSAGNASSASSESGESGDDAAETGVKSYADLELGKDFTDLKVKITMLNHRTDMNSDDYGGVKWKEYLENFNKDYPGIEVDINTDTDYANDSLVHLQSGNYETIMMIPAVDVTDLSTYFMSFGDYETMKTQINYAQAWQYEGQVYGVPSTANAQGIVYNKKVFKEAGYDSVPTTPDAFIQALKDIKSKTDAIPLYTNYAAEWTMGAWDAYIGINATGDNTYMNQKFLHTKDPFKDYGDDTHAYAVYKILYDAVANKLIEDDYTTTDWEGCKNMINEGKIGCMMLGSWAYPQMEAAGPNRDDIGYAPFPITVNGKQYAADGPDYSYGINVNATDDEKNAAMVFIKWMTEKSGFSYNEDGLPIKAGSTETKLAFDGVEFLQDEPALSGEETFLNDLNSESELNVNNGGNRKIQEIIEHADKGDKSFDDIMAEWNQAWSDAQDACGVEVTE